MHILLAKNMKDIKNHLFVWNPVKTRVAIPAANPPDNVSN
jgi:hypothetical protein